MYPDEHYTAHLALIPVPALPAVPARLHFHPNLNFSPSMNKITSLALFVAGIVLLVFGLQSSDSAASSVSEAFTGAPTDKSIWLIVLGVIGLLSGGAGFFLGSRKS